MNTGKTDIRYLLEAFEQGADGVYLVACPIGNCHHVRGNERGQSRVERAKRILDEARDLRIDTNGGWMCSPKIRDQLEIDNRRGDGIR